MEYKPSVNPSTGEPPKPSTSQLLLIPLGCLIRSPLLFIGIFLIGYLFWSISTGEITLLWTTVPEFDTWKIDSAFTSVEDSNGETWKIRYESKNTAVFEGLVRHASPINERAFPLLSHDILVTSGEFADPSLVRTSVSNHRFFWYTDQSNRPAGTINLLHTVPSTEEIYHQLSVIRKGDTVRVKGIEILDIARYDQQGDFRGSWADAGCNTLLVTSVEILPER
ncbi:hypothetical protein BECAL_01830 [Bellilinea caldifistulae]|uniref:Uncharacterized protein n=1 Tax=Bellilinea caldifistulae TaxID=360411 RepID=A0A0P6XRI4_9CHLR|nr:hypothetical protein [Bellilinea caldifistulae]KPL75009.1 hypothetical protein AC812_10925 [Bellilinea caldifistulae]GAP10655.1 hypothetical protein BECAL_01830 [Bellilinea caldifistulae]